MCGCAFLRPITAWSTSAVVLLLPRSRLRTGQDQSLLCGGQVRATLCSRFLKGQSWSPRCCRCQGAWGSSPDSAPPGDAAGAGPPLAGHSPWGICHILGRKGREGCWWWRWGGVLLIMPAWFPFPIQPPLGPCIAVSVVSSSPVSSSPVWRGELAPSLGLSGPLPHSCSEVSLLWVL